MKLKLNVLHIEHLLLPVLYLLKQMQTKSLMKRLTQAPILLHLWLTLKKRKFSCLTRMALDQVLLLISVHNSFVEELQGKGFLKNWKWVDLPCPKTNIGITGVSAGGMCSWFSILFTCLCLDNRNVHIRDILSYMQSRNLKKEFILNFMFRFIYLLDTHDVAPFLRAKELWNTQ